MKQRITETDLMDLTEDQKYSLRSLWMPQERDVAVTYVCTDAESDEYEPVIFTIGRIDLNEGDSQGVRGARYKHFNVMFRTLKLVDDSFYEELEKSEDEEELEFEYQTPDDYFSMNDCLPLLSIGQMFEILSNTYFDKTDFFAAYNREQGKYQMGEDLLAYKKEYYDYEAEELCDVLWEAVRTILQ